MKFRCPYCRKTFGPDPAVACPHCGRAMTLPRALRGEQSELRVPRRDHPSRYDRPASDRLTPTFQFGRKPSTLLLVIGILVVVGGLLIGRVGTRYSRRHIRTAQDIATDAVDVLAEACELFREDCGRLPTPEEGFLVLVSNPGIEGWDGPYINGFKPDPWDTPYRYRVDDTTAIVSSAGPDKRHDSGDDIIAVKTMTLPAEPHTTR